MNEIPRLQYTQFISVSTPTQVAPARPVADKTQSVSVNEQDRRKHSDRRKRNKKPLIERRTSSDRRAPRFEAKA
jgi:hypothetical protein